MTKTVLPFNRLTTIEEVLNYCAEPHRIEDRVKRLQAEAEAFSHLKTFIGFAYSSENAFVHLLPYYEQKPVGKIPNRQEVGFQEFFAKHLVLASLSSGGSLGIKRSRFAQMADFLDPRDFRLITAALQGEFAYTDPRINEMVLKIAFPDLFPNA